MNLRTLTWGELLRLPPTSEADAEIAERIRDGRFKEDQFQNAEEKIQDIEDACKDIEGALQGFKEAAKGLRSHVEACISGAVEGE